MLGPSRRVKEQSFGSMGLRRKRKNQVERTEIGLCFLFQSVQSVLRPRGRMSQKCNLPNSQYTTHFNRSQL